MAVKDSVFQVHMLGEQGGRGALLEQCLCKLLFRSSEERVQLIGMSATLGNASELCRFLGANLFRTQFRPVTLIERIKLQDKLFKVDEQGEWRLEKELERGNKVGNEKGHGKTKLTLRNWKRGTRTDCSNCSAI